jgi:UDP-N-acetylmuramoylalanine--D-glutamate ligase
MINFKDKKVLVMGLGLHGGGVAVSKWLAKKGARVTITDIKKKGLLKESVNKLRGLPVTYVLGRHREKDFKNTDFVIQNPGVPRESKFLKIAEKNGAEIYNEASLFFEFIEPEQIIGITGTRGKSTVTAITHEILKKKYPKTLFGGNIRTNAMFDIIDKVKDNYVVLELSSWQLEGLEKIKKSPHLAVFTNIMEDHLNRYKNLDDYIEAKENIFRYQYPKNFSVFSRYNPVTRRLAKTTPSKRYWVDFKYFPEENGSFVEDDWIYFRQNGKKQKIIKVDDVRLLGKHNLCNVLCSVTTGMILGAGVKNVKSVVRKFNGLSDRMEFIKEVGGIKYYNDTTATTPDATIAALRSIADNKNIILIAGGADKKLDYKKFAKEVKRHCKKVVLFEGEATRKIKRELRKVEYKNFSKEFSSMNDLMKEAIINSKEGDVILLSPGAASFGIFVNEFDRGEQFKKFLSKLK